MLRRTGRQRAGELVAREATGVIGSEGKGWERSAQAPSKGEVVVIGREVKTNEPCEVRKGGRNGPCAVIVSHVRQQASTAS